MKEKYQYTVKEGDIVQMPSGTVGVVASVEFSLGGNSKEVRVFPFTNLLHRFFLALCLKTVLYDKAINKLKLV